MRADNYILYRVDVYIYIYCIYYTTSAFGARNGKNVFLWVTTVHTSKGLRPARPRGDEKSTAAAAAAAAVDRTTCRVYFYLFIYLFFVYVLYIYISAFEDKT